MNAPGRESGAMHDPEFRRSVEDLEHSLAAAPEIFRGQKG